MDTFWAAAGAASWLGTGFDASTAVRSIVRSAVSPVLTSGPRLMGPTPRSARRTVVVALIFSSPLLREAVALNVTGLVACFTWRSPVSSNG